METNNNQTEEAVKEIKISSFKEYERRFKRPYIAAVDPTLFLEDRLNWLEITKDFVQRNPLIFDRNGWWWKYSWSKDIYEVTDETDLMIMIDKATKKYTLRASQKAEILEGLRRAARENQPKKPDKEEIQIGDKVYNWKTGAITKSGPQHFFTNTIPWCMAEEESTPILDAVFESWVGDKAILLKEMIAYCFIRDYPLQRIFVLLGSGSNGKSTFLQVMTKLLGEDNICAAELDAMLVDRFQTSALFNKLACQMGETNFGAMRSTARLKRLSGNDSINFEFKNKNGFTAKNYAKIIIATNSLPMTLDKTDGFYRRWVIVEFKNQFNEKRDILADIPDHEYKAFCKWSLNAIRRLMSEKEFTGEGTVSERKERYESHSNPLEAFIANNYDKLNDVETPATGFYDDFCVYLSQRGHRKQTYQEVRSMLKAMGYDYEKKRVPGFENPVSVIVGLRRCSSVPAVPYLQLKARVGGGGVEVLEQTEQPEQIIDLLKKIINERPLGNAFDIEDKFGQDQVTAWVKSGLIYEMPHGTYRFL